MTMVEQATEAEDLLKMRVGYTRIEHFTWKDAPYRKKPDGSFMYASTRPGSIPPDEVDLAQAIADRLRRSIREDDVVLCPLAIGGHIDHLITRKAAEASGARNLMYYPDVPYQQLFPASLDESVAGLYPVPYALRRDEIVTWVGALRLYVSQMQMLQDAAGELPRLIGKYSGGQLVLYRSSSLDPLDLTAYRIFG